VQSKERTPGEDARSWIDNLAYAVRSAVVLLIVLDGHQFRAAPGISQGFHNILGCEFSHRQYQIPLRVVWIGVRSIRCTYSAARVPLRFTFTTNFVFFIVPYIASGISVEKESLKSNADAPNRFSTAGDSDQPIPFKMIFRSE
jgi:hypothetical protein